MKFSYLLLGFAFAFPSQISLLDSRVNKRLIEFAPEIQEWLSEEEINDLILQDISFMDVTDFPTLERGTYFHKEYFTPKELPKKLAQQPKVNALIEKLDKATAQQFLTAFSSHRNRYYDSKYGQEAAEFLFQYLTSIVKNAKANVTIEKFEHKWKQFSIIAKFPSALPNEQRVIVGAHMDSINPYDRMNGRAPGADDDGSGTTTTLSAFKVLVESGFQPKYPVEFHWYSAEEVGLWGSQAVSRQYKSDKIPVMAMLQNDMTGYVRQNQKQFGLVTDFTNPELTNFVELLMNEYGKETVVRTKCGYGCSDHASWYKLGYRSAFPFETRFQDLNPHIHSGDDLIDYVDFDHLLDFSKVVLGFVYELGNLAH